MKNGIYLVATPIGNISDITLRALDVLKNANIIACEDTRVTKKLFSLLCISTAGKSFVTMHDHNEEEISQNLIDSAKKGYVIAYVSDAGSPLISDPGYKLSKKCRKQNVYITTIPGACAAICALQLSGLPSNCFTFVGFVPNKDKARKDLFNKYKDYDSTLIFYETAPRNHQRYLWRQRNFGCQRNYQTVRRMQIRYGSRLAYLLYRQPTQRRNSFNDCTSNRNKIDRL